MSYDFNEASSHIMNTYGRLDPLITHGEGVYLYDKDKIKKRIKTCYNIDKKTSEELGANIVALGDGRILTSNKTVFHILKKADFEVFYLDYSEILKAGGGFTCSTLYFYIE